MSVEVADEHGPYAQVASNNGFQELVNAAKSDPVLAKFFQTGVTETTNLVADHLEAMPGPSDVRDTARHLAGVIRGKEFALLTRGESADLPDENGVSNQAPQGQQQFKNTRKRELDAGKSDIAAHLTAFKELREAGYIQKEEDKVWIPGPELEEELEKAEPSVGDTHINRPMGAIRYKQKHKGDKHKDDPGTIERKDKKDKAKDDPGTQEATTDDEEKDLELPLPLLQRNQHAHKREVIEKRISGGSNIPLNAKGIKLTKTLGERLHARGGLDTIQSSTLRRGKQTAKLIQAEHPETKLQDPTPELQPWHLGEYEGQEGGSATKEAIGQLIKHPDQRPGGTGRDGSKGETFREATKRQLGYMKDQHDDWFDSQDTKPGQVMHRRGLMLLQAYVDAGEPDIDKFIDDVKSKDLTAKGPEHNTVFRWGDGKMEEVDPESDDKLEGGHYLILHGLTDDDTDDGNADALVKDEDGERRYLPPLNAHLAALAAQKRGANIEGITEPIAAGASLTESDVRKIAAFFAENPVVSNSAAEPWGGSEAGRWAAKLCSKFDQPAHFEIEGTVVKADEEQQLVFGWASIASIDGKIITDTQGDRIPADALEAASYDYVLEARKGGHMHETRKSQKQVEQVAKMVESCIFTREKQQAMQKSLEDQGIHATVDLGCVGWWIGFKVTDPEVWKDIKSGKLRGFSIGGKGKRQKVE